jgi:hypothetical protein
MRNERELANAVATIQAKAPCAVELPAGCGKTHLVAALAASCGTHEERTLLLTHTNAGVDALRRRVRAFSASRYARIRTIDGWAFDLISHFPQLSRLQPTAEPDWERSGEYEMAATRAARSEPVQRMLRVSYDLVVVDEYQDCTVEQHALVLAIAEAVRVVILGDPLQALFGFGDNVLPSWEREVLSHFQQVDVETKPWRWAQSNPPLGKWLMDIRPTLKSGGAIDLGAAPVTWRCSDPVSAKREACYERVGNSGVVALGCFRPDIAAVACQLNGTYTVMEELEAKVLLQLADVIDNADPSSVAEAAAQFAVDCAAGAATVLTAERRRRLGQGKSSGSQQQQSRQVLEAFTYLLTDPSPAQVRRALLAAQALPALRLYCREAWYDALQCLELASLESGLTMRAAVIRVRNYSRVVGRRPDNRVLSRPLLVKGLEYDHAILLDADRYDVAELYVALSRGRHTVTVLSRSKTLTPRQSQRLTGS